MDPSYPNNGYGNASWGRQYNMNVRPPNIPPGPPMFYGQRPNFGQYNHRPPMQNFNPGAHRMPLPPLRSVQPPFEVNPNFEDLGGPILMPHPPPMEFMRSIASDKLRDENLAKNVPLPGELKDVITPVSGESKHFVVPLPGEPKNVAAPLPEATTNVVASSNSPAMSTSTTAETTVSKSKPNVIGKETAKKMLKSFNFAKNLPKGQIKPVKPVLGDDSADLSQGQSISKKKKKNDKPSVIEQIKADETRLRQVLGINKFSHAALGGLSHLNSLMDDPDAMKKFEEKGRNLREKIEKNPMWCPAERKPVSKDRYSNRDSNRSTSRQSSEKSHSQKEKDTSKSYQKKSSSTPKKTSSLKMPKSWKDFKCQKLTFATLKDLYKKSSDIPKLNPKNDIWVGLWTPTFLSSINAISCSDDNSRKLFPSALVKETLTKPRIAYSINPNKHKHYYTTWRESKLRNEYCKDVWKHILTITEGRENVLKSPSPLSSRQWFGDFQKRFPDMDEEVYSSQDLVDVNTGADSKIDKIADQKQLSSPNPMSLEGSPEFALIDEINEVTEAEVLSPVSVTPEELPSIVSGKDDHFSDYEIMDECNDADEQHETVQSEEAAKEPETSAVVEPDHQTKDSDPLENNSHDIENVGNDNTIQKLSLKEIKSRLEGETSKKEKKRLRALKKIMKKEKKKLKKEKKRLKKQKKKERKLLKRKLKQKETKTTSEAYCPFQEYEEGCTDTNGHQSDKVSTSPHNNSDESANASVMNMNSPPVLESSSPYSPSSPQTSRKNSPVPPIENKGNISSPSVMPMMMDLSKIPTPPLPKQSPSRIPLHVTKSVVPQPVPPVSPDVVKNLGHILKPALEKINSEPRLTSVTQEKSSPVDTKPVTFKLSLSKPQIPRMLKASIPGFVDDEAPVTKVRIPLLDDEPISSVSKSTVPVSAASPVIPLVPNSEVCEESEETDTNEGTVESDVPKESQDKSFEDKRSPARSSRRSYSPKRRTRGHSPHRKSRRYSPPRTKRTHRSRSRSPKRRRRSRSPRKSRRSNSPRSHHRSRSRSPKEFTRTRRTRSRTPETTERSSSPDRSRRGKGSTISGSSWEIPVHTGIAQIPLPTDQTAATEIHQATAYEYPERSLGHNPYVDTSVIQSIGSAEPVSDSTSNSPIRPSLSDRLRDEHGVQVETNLSYGDYSHPPPDDHAVSYNWESNNQQWQTAPPSHAQVIRVGNFLQVLPQETVSSDVQPDVNTQSDPKQCVNEVLSSKGLAPSLSPVHEGRISPLPPPSPSAVEDINSPEAMMLSPIDSPVVSSIPTMVPPPDVPPVPTMVPPPVVSVPAVSSGPTITVPGLSSEALITAAAATAAASNVPFAHLVSVLQQVCDVDLCAMQKLLPSIPQILPSIVQSVLPVLPVPQKPEIDVEALKRASKERKERKRREKVERKLERQRKREALIRSLDKDGSDDENSNKDNATEQPEVQVPEEEDVDINKEVEYKPSKKGPWHPSLDFPPPEKGILAIHSYSSQISRSVKRKRVVFADDILPGDGTSDGEEVQSPPHTDNVIGEKKKKKLRKSKKRKISLIKQFEMNSDGMTSPPPPPNTAPIVGSCVLYPGWYHRTKTDTNTYVIYTQQPQVTPNAEVEPVPVQCYS